MTLVMPRLFRELRRTAAAEGSDLTPENPIILSISALVCPPLIWSYLSRPAVLDLSADSEPPETGLSQARTRNRLPNTANSVRNTNCVFLFILIPSYHNAARVSNVYIGIFFDFIPNIGKMPLKSPSGLFPVSTGAAGGKGSSTYPAPRPPGNLTPRKPPPTPESSPRSAGRSPAPEHPGSHRGAAPPRRTRAAPPGSSPAA